MPDNFAMTTDVTRATRPPRPRGPISQAVLTTLAGDPDDDVDLGGWPAPQAGSCLTDGDEQLALFCLYELHYRGITGVDERWEWAPELIRYRAVLESRLEDALRASVEVPADVDESEVAQALFALADQPGGPSVSRYLSRKGTLEQFKEYLVVRSIYQLKEADPHTWAIPRVQGAAKAGLVEIQADEYGNGSVERLHSRLYAQAMAGVGLDPTYGAYLDHVPAIVLASANAISLFGLHRRLRGAAVGHLAAVEMTSAVPMRRYAQGLARLGLNEQVQRYFTEHIEADAVHEQLAAHAMARPLALAEPDLAGQILFGAAVCHRLEEMMAERLMDAWDHDRSVLMADPPERS